MSSHQRRFLHLQPLHRHAFPSGRRDEESNPSPHDKRTDAEPRQPLPAFLFLLGYASSSFPFSSSRKIFTPSGAENPSFTFPLRSSSTVTTIPSPIKIFSFSFRLKISKADSLQKIKHRNFAARYETQTKLSTLHSTNYDRCLEHFCRHGYVTVLAT